MKKALVAIAGAASMTLGACSTTSADTGDVTTGAGIGAAAGAGLGAAVGGLGIIEGAVIGAAVGGIAGAVWADQNNDGCVDGYYQNGQYYTGAPAPQPAPGYAPPPPSYSRSGERG